MLLPNVSDWRSKRNVMQHIFPTTPIEIGPGFIRGMFCFQSYGSLFTLIRTY
jgi:hypothetical protein